MLVTITISFIIIGLLALLLGIKVLFTKDGSFPETHIDGNQALKEKGISCAKSQDKQMRKHKNLFELTENENINY